MSEGNERLFTPASALWLNRFMFAVIALIWIPGVALAALGGKFTFQRSAPLLVVAALGIGYLAAFRRSPELHRLLGIVANIAVVVGGAYALITMVPIGSQVVASLLALAALILIFAYPLFLLVRSAGSHEGERA